MGIDNDIEVKHTDFSQNDIARTALFGNSEYKDELYKVLNGNIDVQIQIANRVFVSSYKCHNVSSSNEMFTNYKFLLCLVAPFDNNGGYRKAEYEEYALGKIPQDLNCSNLFKVNYHNLVSGMM